MDMITALRTCFEKYADFEGRARRSEYWWLWLFLFICNALLSVVDDYVGSPIIGGFFIAATLLPTIAAAVRRLHDTDRSGWWLTALLGTLGLSFCGYLLGITAIVWLGAIATLVALALLLAWLAADTMAGPNRFGPSPK
ncbi:MAG: DUF805 domain-containing protein [Hyphomicrobiaceae bacterium]